MIYFKIADKYNIIDKPNERSSHTQITIRGGGVVFLISMIVAGIMYPEYWMPILGAFIIGTISFIDDQTDLSRKVRIVFHLAAVTLLFYFLTVFALPWWLIIGLYILVIGIINAYNFMDGINGMTGLYSLVVLGGLQYVNLYEVAFVEKDLIWLPMMATVVFLFFNFRKKAKCFAGDVGSIAMAFWILMLLLTLIIQTNDWMYLLFLSVYGVDAVLTILHRLMLKQNIFKAHRLHYYQILANEQKKSHRLVSAAYAILQLISITILILGDLDFIFGFLITTLPLILLYIITKPKLMGYH